MMSLPDASARCKGSDCKLSRRYNYTDDMRLFVHQCFSASCSVECMLTRIAIPSKLKQECVISLSFYYLFVYVLCKMI